MEEKKQVNILYTNWRGETAVRRIIPQEVVFTSNKWHTEEQWLLVAFDVDKQAGRTFACKDIKNWFI